MKFICKFFLEIDIIFCDISNDGCYLLPTEITLLRSHVADSSIDEAGRQEKAAAVTCPPWI